MQPFEICVEVPEFDKTFCGSEMDVIQQLTEFISENTIEGGYFKLSKGKPLKLHSMGTTTIKCVGSHLKSVERKG